MTVYHVTRTQYIPRIQELGLLLKQKPNWYARQGWRPDGALYAFEVEVDAVRWAAKMDWELHQATGTGHISVLTLDTAHEWDDDFRDPFGQAASVGRWLKTFTPVPATCITCVTALTPDMVQRVVLV